MATRTKKKTASSNGQREWALPVDLLPDPLRLRLDFHEDSILLYSHQGAVTYTRQVSAADIALALSRELNVTSQLLPADALWWKNSREGPLVALWRPPKVWAVALQEEPFQPPRRLKLPMPGLVFICGPARAPWVLAAKKRPKELGDHLYHVPTYNVFRDGRVCPGTHKFSADISRIPDEFFLAFFSKTGDAVGRSNKHPKSILDLWNELDGQPEYPTGDMTEWGTVEQAMAIPDRR